MIYGDYKTPVLKGLPGEQRNLLREQDLSPSSNIHASYRSDHHMISLQLKLSNYKKGKGSWKFNNSLLNNNDFIKLIKSEISLIKETYALPIYNPEIVPLIKDSDLEMIPDTLFIDTLLCQLRAIIISFSKK